jgi:outer membrane immunogenic protein
MKRIALGALLAVAAAIPAQAADMPVKAAPPIIPLYNWSGFYIGGNLGYSWGRSSTDAFIGSTAGATLATASRSADLDGWLGGFQLGFNWQSGNTVWGFEADIQATGQKASWTSSCATALCAAVPITATLDHKLDWFSTFRLRLGWTFTPTTLLYITGGGVVGEVKNDLTLSSPTVTAIGSRSNTEVGWTIGAGLETALGASNWTGKLEYLYLDIGSSSDVLTTTIPAAGGGFLTLNRNSRVTDHIFRVGLNYRFGR